MGIHHLIRSQGNKSFPTGFNFNYDNFSSTNGLILVGNSVVRNNNLYLTTSNTSNVPAETGNIYTDKDYFWCKDFSITFELEFGKEGTGLGSEGWCIQWTETNDTIGSRGQDQIASWSYNRVGSINVASTIHCIRCHGSTDSRFSWFNYNTLKSTAGAPLPGEYHSLRSYNYYGASYKYWLDYNHSQKTMKIYYDLNAVINNGVPVTSVPAATKPASPNMTFSNFVFTPKKYYLSFGAANNTNTPWSDNHIIKNLNVNLPE